MRELVNKRRMFGQIFTKSQNKIQYFAKLSQLIDMVNDTDWVMMGADTKGAIYEEPLLRYVQIPDVGVGSSDHD